MPLSVVCTLAVLFFALAAIGQSPSDVVLQVNQGLVPLHSGLEKLHTMLALAAEDDFDSTRDEAPGVLTVSSLADAVALLERGDTVENLAAVLGLDAFGAAAAGAATVEDLFSALLTNQSLTTSVDAVLVRYLALQRIREEGNNPLFYVSTNGLLYLSQRIDRALRDALERAASTAGMSLAEIENAIERSRRDAVAEVPPMVAGEVRRVLSIYSPVVYLGLEPKWIYQHLGSVAHLISFAHQTATNHRLLAAILRYWVHGSKDLPLSRQELRNALEHARWAVDGFARQGGRSFDAQTALDHLSSLFDMDPGRYRGVQLPEWVNLLDERTGLVRHWLRLLEAAPDSPLRGDPLPRHPYPSLYLSRALIRRGQELPPGLAFNTLTHLEESVERRVRESQGVASPGPAPVGRRPTAEEERSLYHWGFYRVEILRFFIEARSLTARVTEPADERVDVYRRLRRELATTLDYRFGVDLAGAPAGRGLAVCGDDAHHDSRYRCLREIADEVVESAGLLSLDLGGHRFLPPGIYESDLGLSIRGDSLDFHPLALITAPGKRVNLILREASDLWIDVSGNTPAVPLETPRGTPPEVTCPGTSKIHPEHEGRRVCWANGKPVSEILVPGTPPAAPQPAPGGQKGGGIKLTITGANQGSHLLVALGGDGAAGYPGGLSPLCDPQRNLAVEPPDELEERPNPPRPNPNAGYRPLFHHTVRRRLGDHSERTRPGVWCKRRGGPFPHFLRVKCWELERGVAIHVDGGPGGDGGPGADGGQVWLDLADHALFRRHQNGFFVASGRPGTPGPPGFDTGFPDGCRPPGPPPPEGNPGAAGMAGEIRVDY